MGRGNISKVDSVFSSCLMDDLVIEVGTGSECLLFSPRFHGGIHEN